MKPMEFPFNHKFPFNQSEKNNSSFQSFSLSGSCMVIAKAEGVEEQRVANKV